MTHEQVSRIIGHKQFVKLTRDESGSYTVSVKCWFFDDVTHEFQAFDELQSWATAF